MKALISIKYIGLVNLILGRNIGDEPLVKEYIQPTYSDQIELMVELNKIDNDEEYRKAMISGFKNIRYKLSQKPWKNLKDIVKDVL